MKKTLIILFLILQVINASSYSKREYNEAINNLKKEEIVKLYRKVKVVMAIVIAFTEGTKGEDQYDKVYGFNRYIEKGMKPLSSQTIGEVLNTMSSMLKKQKAIDRRLKKRGKRGINHFSTAVGFLQINRKTLKSHMKKCGFTKETIFSKEVQEELLMSILEEIGIRAYISERISRKDFFLRMSRRWASLPDPRSGKSYYKGQKAKISIWKLNKLFDLASLPN
jgi:hypothetical protein